MIEMLALLFAIATARADDAPPAPSPIPTIPLVSPLPLPSPLKMKHPISICHLQPVTQDAEALAKLAAMKTQLGCAQ